MTDIFVSYASADRARVKPLVEALQQRGWSVWWDRTILAGKAFDRVIEAAVKDSRCVIVLWSKDSVESDWVWTEADEGKRRGILVPALLDDVHIPFAFRRIQTAKLIGWSGELPNDQFDELARAVADVLSSTTAPPPSSPVVPVLPDRPSTPPSPPAPVDPAQPSEWELLENERKARADEAWETEKLKRETELTRAIVNDWSRSRGEESAITKQLKSSH